MITDKIEDFIRSGDQRSLNPDYMGVYMDDLLNGFRRQYFDEYKDRRTLRLSSIGKCLRMQAYNILNYPKLDSITPRLKMIFHMGDIIEANLIALANHAGCNIHSQQKECELAGVKGHIDGIIDHEGKKYVVEVKSMSGNSFNITKRKGMSDDFGYVSQANSYAYALGMDGIVWICQNKDNSQLYEEIRDVDVALAENTIYNIDALKLCKDPTQFKQYDVEEETWMGKAKFTGNKILSFTCGTCAFTDTCWDGCTKYLRKNKIKYYAGEIKHGKWSEGGRII